MNCIDTLALARRVADAAAGLDIIKTTCAPTLAAEATQHIEDLHDIANEIAGELVGEVYAKGD